VIRRLVLKNWRNYEDIDLRLEPGTTFIVAPNGVGKTSLMEAASWAIFGMLEQRPRGAVRKGAASATASVEIQFPDQRILAVTRPLPSKATAALPEPTAYLDNKRISASTLQDHLRDAFAADPAFLVRLTMPRGHIDVRGPAEFGLEEHLCHFFRIDALRQAVDNLDERIKSQQKLIKAVKQRSVPSAAELSSLRDRIAANETTATAAKTAHAHVSAALERARAADHSRTLLRDWHRRTASYMEAVAALAAKAAPELALDPKDPASAQARLDAAISSAWRDLEDLRVRRGELKGRSAAIAQHSNALESAHGDCPVCRRPLDTGAVSFARSAHGADLERLGAEDERLAHEESEIARNRDRLQALLLDFRGLPHPGEKPFERESSDTADDRPVDELSSELHDSFERLVQSRSELARAQSELDSMLADQSANMELQRLYTQDAALRASREAISATKNQLLRETIQPLAREIDQRWRQLFPDRGRLHIQSTGAVSRELGDEALPDSDFSTGERTGLVILLRLLVLDTMTKANFCWLDEPLEHLDPEARRKVAGILARAGSVGATKQVVVTTYEEPLARRVQERDPKNVSLVYVRPSAS
jgi:recombinational DNA repair ATPase RecF